MIIHRKCFLRIPLTIYYQKQLPNYQVETFIVSHQSTNALNNKARDSLNLHCVSINLSNDHLHYFVIMY